jgi:hypothetical protein
VSRSTPSQMLGRYPLATAAAVPGLGTACGTPDPSIERARWMGKRPVASGSASRRACLTKATDHSGPPVGSSDSYQVRVETVGLHGAAGRRGHQRGRAGHRALLRSARSWQGHRSCGLVCVGRCDRSDPAGPWGHEFRSGRDGVRLCPDRRALVYAFFTGPRLNDRTLLLTPRGLRTVQQACPAARHGSAVTARVALNQLDGQFVHIELEQDECSSADRDIRMRTDQLRAVLPQP